MAALTPSPDSSPRQAANGAPGTAGAPPRPGEGFHGAVTEFKRRLIEAVLTQSGGNRTRAARALGLQRTYLLRLMRDFEIRIPAGSAPPRPPAPSSARAPTQTH